jgi:hypothetical protein
MGWSARTSVSAAGFVLDRGTSVVSRSSARRAACALAAARTAVGVVAYALPALPARPWVGEQEARRPAVQLFARTLGARDIALGLGGIVALRRGASARGWIEAGGLADAGDSVATLLSFAKLPRVTRWLVLGSTLAAAGAACVLAPFVDGP